MKTLGKSKHDGLNLETMKLVLYNTALMVLSEASAKEFISVVFSEVKNEEIRDLYLSDLSITFVVLYSRLKKELAALRKQEMSKLHLFEQLRRRVMEAEMDEVKEKLTIISVLMKLFDLVKKGGEEYEYNKKA